MFFDSTYHEANIEDDAQKRKSGSRRSLSRCPLASLDIPQIQTIQMVDDCVFGDCAYVFF